MFSNSLPRQGPGNCEDAEWPSKIEPGAGALEGQHDACSGLQLLPCSPSDMQGCCSAVLQVLVRVISVARLGGDSIAGSQTQKCSAAQPPRG